MGSDLRPIRLAAFLIVVGLLVAGRTEADVPGYAQDSRNQAIRNNFGECWRAPRSPTTLPNVQCEPDRDRDGVADMLDECPYTATGMAVDARGCAVDTDGDGVPDDEDICPDTPAGVPVNAVGCPSDSDGDGVPDDADKCPETREGAQVGADGCELIGDLVLTGAEGPNFKLGSAELTDHGKDWLNKRLPPYVRAAQEGRISEILLIGHTDSTGNAAYNQALSERRASAIGRHMASKGIPAELIIIEGRGETEPVAGNDTEEGRARNRRVEINVSAAEQ